MGRSWGVQEPVPLRPDPWLRSRSGSFASSWAPGTSESLRAQSPRAPVPLTARVGTVPRTPCSLLQGAPYLVSPDSPAQSASSLWIPMSRPPSVHPVSPQPGCSAPRTPRALIPPVLGPLYVVHLAPLTPRPQTLLRSPVPSGCAVFAHCLVSCTDHPIPYADHPGCWPPPLPIAPNPLPQAGLPVSPRPYLRLLMFCRGWGWGWGCPGGCGRK